MAFSACASDLAADRRLAQAKVAPAEIAILQVEDRSPGGWALPDALRSALVARAVDVGFSPLSRTFVDQAVIDPDIPAMGSAGVLRMRILSWVNSEADESVLSVRYHMTLHVKGRILADVLQGERLQLPPALQSQSPERRTVFLMEQLAERIFEALPPPPTI